MGFLDHSTNNIIIDAVLTDIGRKYLADNRGRFRIAFFSLGDDEVDYSIIDKYGRSVGKEKIAKNTPIFEAQTQSSLALKNRLVTLPDPTVLRLPVLLNTTATNFSNNQLEFNQNTSGKKSNTVTLEQTVVGETHVPDGVSDVTFTILVPDRFLTVSGKTPISVESTTRTATYSKTRDQPNTQGGSIVSFTLIMKSLDNTIFNIYGNQDNKNVISSVVSVIGDQSGIRNDFKVQLTK